MYIRRFRTEVRPFFAVYNGLPLAHARGVNIEQVQRAHLRCVSYSVDLLNCFFIVTLCACARGKVIGSVIVVVVITKIARSQVLGVSASASWR